MMNVAVSTPNHFFFNQFYHFNAPVAVAEEEEKEEEEEEENPEDWMV